MYVSNSSMWVCIISMFAVSGITWAPFLPAAHLVPIKLLMRRWAILLYKEQNSYMDDVYPIVIVYALFPLPHERYYGSDLKCSNSIFSRTATGSTEKLLNILNNLPNNHCLHFHRVWYTEFTHGLPNYCPLNWKPIKADFFGKPAHGHARYAHSGGCWLELAILMAALVLLPSFQVGQTCPYFPHTLFL